MFFLPFTFSWLSSADWMPWVGGEGWGSLYVFPWKAYSVQATTCLFTRLETSSQQQHREEGPASPEETESSNSCSRLWDRCSVGTWVLKNFGCKSCIVILSLYIWGEVVHPRLGCVEKAVSLWCQLDTGLTFLTRVISHACGWLQ